MDFILKNRGQLGMLAKRLLFLHRKCTLALVNFPKYFSFKAASQLASFFDFSVYNVSVIKNTIYTIGLQAIGAFSNSFRGLKQTK